MDVPVNVRELMSPAYPSQVSRFFPFIIYILYISILNKTIFDFQQNSYICSKAWIGLDHMNKAPKRHTGRFGYLEKAIKIHNWYKKKSLWKTVFWISQDQL